VQVGPEDAVRVVTEWNFASGSHALTVAHPDLLTVLEAALTAIEPPPASA
jgi:hypothetical protein